VIDYLLGLYFHRYQLMLKFVSQNDFMAQKAAGRGPAFRPSLMLAMMAAGLRYSTRKEVTEAFIRPDGENALAAAAKKALEPELRCSSITTVQSLLILAEVETSRGNEMTGYLYSSMAFKLIFELHLDLGSMASMSFSHDEIGHRHWLVWVASVGDQYWAVSLRRPLAIKSHTLQVARLAARLARNGSINPHESSIPSVEHQVDEALLDLMELAREVTDSLYGSAAQQDGPQASTATSKLRTRLEQWFAELPDKMRRGPVGGEDSYHFLFVLHLLFNAVKILLHQDAIRMVEPPGHTGTIQRPMLNPSVAESRTVCATAAGRIANLFEIFRRREDIRTLQCTGVQWATISTNALIQLIRLIPVEEAVEAVAHLQSLGRTLKEMSKTFQPAVQPYKDSCKTVQLAWSRLNDEDGPNQTAFAATPLTTASVAPHMTFSQPWRTVDVPTRLEVTKNLGSSMPNTNVPFNPMPDSTHMGTTSITTRDQDASTLRTGFIGTGRPSPSGNGAASGSWSDSWEWEDVLSQ
jgi:hypothetical protein